MDFPSTSGTDGLNAFAGFRFCDSATYSPIKTSPRPKRWLHRTITAVCSLTTNATGLQWSALPIPWSLSEDRNGSRIQRRSSSDCDDSGTPGRRCAPTINSPAREKGGSAFVPDGLVHEGKLARRPRRARALALIQDDRSRHAPVEPAVSRFLLGQHPHSHSPDQHCQVPKPAERCQQSHDRPREHRMRVF